MRERLGAKRLGGLLWTLARTDFKSRYHGTLGGFFWALLKPTALFIVLLAIFSVVFATDRYYKFNLVIGLFLWDFFSEGTKAGLISLHARGFLVTRARFSRWILVASSISNALTTLVVFSLVMFGAVALLERVPTVRDVALFLCYQVAMVAIVIGISLGASVLFLRYRDLNQVWEVVLQTGFFLAPVIYPLDILPERYHFYLFVWPPTPVIEFSRDVILHGEAPTATAHLMLAGVTVVTLGAGILCYRRLGPRAAEYL